MKIPPNTRDIRACRRCFRTIRLVALVNGKQLPVNPEPADNGRLVAYYDDQRGMYTGAWFAASKVVLESSENAALFVPHSDDCKRPGSR